MRRTILCVAVGLVLGSALHIVIVLLVPSFAVQDAWSRMDALGGDGEFHLLPATDEQSIGLRDPHLVETVCRFALDAGPVRITARFPDSFWTAAIFDSRGRNIYSLNDAAGGEIGLDLILLTTAQAPLLATMQPPPSRDAIAAELPIEAGLLVLRAFAPDTSARESFAELLARADCNAPV